MNRIACASTTTGRLGGQFFRYFLVGGLAFVVDFTLLFLLTNFGQMHYLLSASIAFMAGVAITYTLSVLWVFDHRRIDNRLHEFALFACVGLLGVGLNAGAMWIFTEQAGLHYLSSKIAAAALIFMFNFGARKVLLFSARGDVRDSWRDRDYA